MNENRFDDLAKGMAKQTSRRGVLRVLAVGAAGGVLGAIGLRGASTADAKGPCVPLTNPCNTNPNDRGCCGANTTCLVEEDATGVRSGHCVCATGFFACNGQCIATGSCCTDADCPRANDHCENGACVCDTGYKLCNGACIPNASCCTNADCPAGANSDGTCTNGTCSYTCKSGFTDCNGDVGLGAAGTGCECASPNTCAGSPSVCTAPPQSICTDPRKPIQCTNPRSGQTKCCPHESTCEFTENSVRCNFD